MTASSAVVLGNLAYLIGAVVLATIGGLIVWLRHRQPRSVHANVESFHRGLQALAPATNHSGSTRGSRPAASGGLRIQREPDPAEPTDSTTPGEMVRRVLPDSADLDLTGELPLRTNGSGAHDAPDRELAAEAHGREGGVVHRASDRPDDVMGPLPAIPSWENGSVGPPPVSPAWENAWMDPPPPSLPWDSGVGLPPVSPPVANGPGDPPTVSPLWANGSADPPPVSAPPANGSIDPLPASASGERLDRPSAGERASGERLDGPRSDRARPGVTDRRGGVGAPRRRTSRSRGWLETSPSILGPLIPWSTHAGGASFSTSRR